MKLAYHFAGTGDASQEIIKYGYKYFVKFNANEEYVNDFNNHITLLYPSTEDYKNSKQLIDYINANNINSINIYNDVDSLAFLDNVKKIVYFKKVLDEKYDELNEYLLFVDGGDVIVNVNFSFEEIIEKFKSYNCEVLFNKDYTDFPYCFSDIWNIEGFYFKDYFDIPNLENLDNIEKKHFINSGAYFGKKEHVKEVVDLCYQILIDNKDKGWKSDQYIFKKAARIINEKYGRKFIDVDYDERLFLCKGK